LIPIVEFLTKSKEEIHKEQNETTKIKKFKWNQLDIIKTTI